jgi:uncharacterized membrane protein (UPF0127 family)
MRAGEENIDCGQLPPAGNNMMKPTYCVYNQTRECFLSFGVVPADTTFARLKGLIGRLKMRSDEGLWVVPSSGVHTWGVLFPLDLIYLNDELRVIEVMEHFPIFKIAPLIIRAASVLELPIHTIYSSQTQPGDQLVIGPAEEIERLLGREVPDISPEAVCISDQPKELSRA